MEYTWNIVVDTSIVHNYYINIDKSLQNRYNL